MRRHSNVSIDTRLMRKQPTKDADFYTPTPHPAPFSRKPDSHIYTPDSSLPYADPSDVILLTTAHPTHDWHVSVDTLRAMDSDTLALCTPDMMATLFKV